MTTRVNPVRNVIQGPLCLLLALLMGCTPVDAPKGTPAASAALLHQGHISLHPIFRPSDPAKQSLDLDLLESGAPQARDLRVDVIQTSDGYTMFAIAPVNGALGRYVRTMSGSDPIGPLDNLYAECLRARNSFLRGSAPVGPGDLFCWQSNGGHLAALVIEKGYGPPAGEFTVDVAYVVWK